ncbi:MAG: molybdate ABC transporter permease subunit [Myxococcales bacterium]|nr:molybdate ABC transporter permease subunit [Myxococcales bacterium]
MNWDPLWLSYKVATIATLMSIIVGVGVATLLSQVRFRGRELVDALVTVPMVMPPTVLGYYVLTAVGKNSWLGQTYESLTGGHIAFSVVGCVIAAFVGSVPLVIKSARSALERVDPTVVRAARTLGASPLRAYLTVQLPLAAPGIAAGVMLAFARALGDFGVTVMVAGSIPGQTQTAALYVYEQVAKQAPAGAMVAVLTATAIGVLYAVNSIGRRADVQYG